MSTKMKQSDKKIRSFAKGISWRVLASLTTVLLVFLFTKEASLSLGIGSFEFSAKIFLFYFHERIWNKIKWGRHYG